MLLTCPICAQHAHAAEEGEVFWEYEGQNGPHMWGALDPSFAVCSSGAQQSPIDLADAAVTRGGALDIQWQSTPGRVVDNGYTVQVNMEGGNALMLDDRRFSLLQFHFHLPSEHTLEGNRFPMEVHFVHQAEEGDLAVIGVFMQSGDANDIVAAVWESIPDPGAAGLKTRPLDLTQLLPQSRNYLRYAGSLTTPPCSEIVSWVVMAEPISVSPDQIYTFEALYPMNARPLQALNERTVTSN